jgi:hypothetical protein
MKNKPLNIIIGLIVGFLAYNLAPMLLGSAKVDRGDITASLKEQDQNGLYATIGELFPQEYNGLIDQLTTVANSPDLSEDQIAGEFETRARAFTETLRRDNVEFIVQAPIEDIRAIQTQNVALMKTFADNPEACGRFSATGLASFALSDLTPAQMDLIGQSATLAFTTIGHGKANPTDNPVASDADMGAFFQTWVSTRSISPEKQQALANNDFASPVYCDTLISFFEYMLATDTPESDAVMLKLTSLIAVN